MILISAFMLLSQDYNLLLQWPIAFLRKSFFCFSTSFKIFYHWLKVRNKADIILLDIVLYNRAVTQDTYQTIFLLMNAYFASKM